MAKLGRILIVGGGIAGLTVAAALRQSGFDPQLVERNTSWLTVGAGIAMQPNAMRALRRLGVATAVENAGALIRRFVFRDQRGETLCAIDLDELWGDVGRVVCLERAKLQDALLGAADGVPCRLGTWITSLTQADRGVSVEFNDGKSGHYDLVIGADGIASSVRQLALSSVGPSYGGQMVWRSLAPIRAAEIQFWLGDGCFFGLFPVSDERTYGFGYTAEPQRRQDPVHGRLGRLRGRFAGFGELVSAYLASVESDDAIHCSAVEWLELDRWHEGHVVLIGDAAHASSPMMGQGGCLAIEDALVLAELLYSSESIENALEAYVRRRRPRVDWVQNQSRILGQSVLLPPAVRDGVLRERGERMFKERYAPLIPPP
jgi:2-polyprenyl-6-methoxyphenol hydroxylase-like FAD-dependent oxidoreductase